MGTKGLDIQLYKNSFRTIVPQAFTRLFNPVAPVVWWYPRMLVLSSGRGKEKGEEKWKGKKRAPILLKFVSFKMQS